MATGGGAVVLVTLSDSAVVVERARRSSWPPEEEEEEEAEDALDEIIDERSDVEGVVQRVVAPRRLFIPSIALFLFWLDY